MSRGCRVYLGNLAKDVRERDIERKFDKYGRVRDILVKYGYGFVEYDDPRDAEDAVHGMDGRDFLGERLQVEIARGTRRDRSRDRRTGRRAPWMDKYGPPQRTKYKVVVENLSTRVSWQDLKDVMRRVAEVCYADAHRERKNEGLLEFLTRSDMEKAIDKFDGYEMNGRAIKLVDCSRRSRSRSRSRRRSRSRSRSRRSRSNSRRSRSKSSRKSKRSRSRSKDESDSKKTKRSSRSRSKSNRSRSKSNRSRSKSKRSRSGSKRSRSRSNRSRSKSGSRSARSRSRSMDAARVNGTEDHEAKKENSRSRSRSRSGDNQQEDQQDNQDSRPGSRADD